MVEGFFFVALLTRSLSLLYLLLYACCLAHLFGQFWSDDVADGNCIGWWNKGCFVDEELVIVVFVVVCLIWVAKLDWTRQL